MKPFVADADICLGFFKHFWDGGLLPELPRGGRVLEIGCAEADWLGKMRDVRPDLHLTGIDWRHEARPAADIRIQGDVLTHDFEPAWFDAVIAVSMIEWAGTSKYGDPEDPDGDLHTLQRARTWIAPTGWLYFDVPYQPVDHVEPKWPRNGVMRVYSDVDLAKLLRDSGWNEVRRQTFSDTGHPDGPYVAMLARPA